MNAERDDILDALRAELAAVEPSPRFAAGVRERVEQQSSRRLPGLRFALAAATVGAVAIGAYMMRPEEAVQPISIQTSAPVAGPIPTTAAPVSQPRARVQPPAPSPRRATALAAATTVVADSGPNLEVITNQPALIRRVWAGIEGGVARTGLPADEFVEITVAPIVVDAIVVPRIGPPGGGGVVPGARRVTSDDSARGDQR